MDDAHVFDGGNHVHYLAKIVVERMLKEKFVTNDRVFPHVWREYMFGKILSGILMEIQMIIWFVRPRCSPGEESGIQQFSVHPDVWMRVEEAVYQIGPRAWHAQEHNFLVGPVFPDEKHAKTIAAGV